MFVVLAEINARSTRDEAVRSVVAKNDRGWKRFLMEILKEGIQKREFRARLGAEAAAEAIRGDGAGLECYMLPPCGCDGAPSSSTPPVARGEVNVRMVRAAERCLACSVLAFHIQIDKD
jgi:hypothetical protein